HEGPAQGAEPRAHEPLPSLQGTVHCLLGLKSRGGRVMNARRASALRSPLGRNALHTEGMSRSRPVLATAPRVQAPFSLALCKARGMEQRRSLLPPLRRGEDGGGGCPEPARARQHPSPPPPPPGRGGGDSCLTTPPFRPPPPLPPPPLPPSRTLPTTPATPPTPPPH